MFKGMRNLESQSSGGKPGVTESKRCALHGNMRGNAQDYFDLMVRDPAGRQGHVSGMCWILLPTHPRMMPGPQSRKHSRVRCPCAGVSLLSPEEFCVTHLQSGGPSNSVFSQVSSRLPWLLLHTRTKSSPNTSSSRSTQTKLVLEPARSEKLLCALCCNKKNWLKQ